MMPRDGEIEIWVFLPEDVVNEFIRRKEDAPSLPDHIVFREMARDGVL